MAQLENYFIGIKVNFFSIYILNNKIIDNIKIDQIIIVENKQLYCYTTRISQKMFAIKNYNLNL